MSGIEMSAGLTTILSLAGGISEQIEYWRKYRGRRIRIENVNHEHHPSLASTNEVRYVIEGEISKVMSFPPGFLLKEVSERVVEREVSGMMGSADETDNLIRESRERFVSFRAIQQLEFVEQNENTK
ncbi:hypothetical protein [Haloferax volcanii]|uniref:hypothetical protein n=1 Tax=Haloferax volcanii TaxID=2246 RepID=UPI003D302426